MMKDLTNLLEIDSYNGKAQEGYEEYYPIKAVLEDEGFHCSGKGKNFDLVLKLRDDMEIITVTNFECLGPENCTAPIKCGGFFISSDKPKVKEYTSKFNDVDNKEKFETLLKENSLKGFFFETDRKTIQGSVVLETPLEGKWIHIKLIMPHVDDNIDIERVAIFGFQGKIEKYEKMNVPSEISIMKIDPKEKICSFKKGWWIIRQYFSIFPILAIIFPERSSEDYKKAEIQKFQKVFEQNKGNFAFYYGEIGEVFTNRFLQAQGNKIMPKEKQSYMIVDTFLYVCEEGKDVNEFISLYKEKKLKNVIRNSEKETEDKRNAYFKELFQMTANNKEELLKEKESIVLVYPQINVLLEFAAVTASLQDDIKKKIHFCACNHKINDIDLAIGVYYFKGLEKISEIKNFTADNIFDFIKKSLTDFEIEIIKNKVNVLIFQEYLLILEQKEKIETYIKEAGEEFKEIEKVKDIVKKISNLREEVFKKDFVKIAHASKLVKSEVIMDIKKMIEKKKLKNVRKPHSMEEFNELFQTKNKLVIVDFFAEWCGPCRHIAPTYANLSEEFTDVLFIKVDCDEVKGITKKYNVTCFPTFQFFKNQEKVDEFSGANAKKLREFVMKHQ